MALLGPAMRVLSLALGRGSAATVRSTGAMGALTNSVMGLIDPIGKIIEVFGKMDKLQVKSLALGTNATKFLTANTDSLKKLRGGFFENANEMFANFEAGITENSDSLNNLQNRMRLTGQKTEVSRVLAVKMLNYTGNNIMAVDRLAKSNIQLAKTGFMTNERLLNLVASLDDVTADRSLFGESEQFSELVQTIGASIGAGGEEMTKAAIRFMTETKSLAQSQMMGFKELDLSNTSEAIQTFFENLRKSETFKQNFLGGGSANSRIKLQGLESMGVKESLTSMTNLLKKLDNPNQIDKDLRTKEDKFYDSFATYSEEFSNISTLAAIYYENALNITGWAAKQVDKVAKYANKENAAKILLLVPNLIYGAIESNFEHMRFKENKNAMGGKYTTADFLSAKLKEKEEERKLKEQTKNNLLIEENNKNLKKLIDVNTVKTISNPNDFMAQVLYQAGRTIQRNKAYEEQSIKQAQMTNELLAQLKASGIKFSGR